MIVVDTNTIAYLYLPNDYTDDVQQLVELDAQWIAPLLWRSEMRNILALYVRKKILSIDIACKIQTQAEALLGGREYTLDSTAILSLAQASGCTAYDCEFIALAQSQGAALITADKKLLTTFSDIAYTAKEYILQQQHK